MVDEHHGWKLGFDPPKLRLHSLAKHEILAQYLRRYVRVLTANVNIPHFRLTLVDGFSGGGLYLDNLTGEQRFGSPLLMLHAMKDAESAAQQRREKKFLLDTQFFFVEKSRDSFEYLQRQLLESEFKYWSQNSKLMLTTAFSNCTVNSLIILRQSSST